MALVPKDYLAVECFRDVKFNLKTSCTICTEEFDNKTHLPKVLACGHSICVTCVKNLLQALEVSYSGDGEVFMKFACPICRTVMDIPPRNAEGFPNNFQLLEAIAPQDSRLMTCSTCKSNGSESTFHICRECTVKEHEFDIHTIINEEPPIHPDTYTVCSTCVLKKHNGPGHTVIEYVPIRLDYQFKKNKKSVDVLQTQMTQKFSEVRIILQTIPKLVEKKETEVNKIVEFMQRAKSRQNMDMIFKTYTREMDDIIKMLDVLRSTGSKLNEMVEEKVKKLEIDNEEMSAKNCFPERQNLREVLKITGGATSSQEKRSKRRRETQEEEIQLPGPEPQTWGQFLWTNISAYWNRKESIDNDVSDEGAEFD